MSTEVSETLVMLAPESVIEPDVTNVRPWSSRQGDGEEELRKIEALAATIEEEGQIQPIRVRAVDSGYEVIAGRRRLKAVKLINAARKPGEELRVAAVVVDHAVTDTSATRQALIENWHRENISPMDMAMDIVRVREENKWVGKKHTKAVAEYFKTSPTTITQYEKLLDLEIDIQHKIHDGVVSRDAAFALVNVPANKRPEVLDDAIRRQTDEASKANSSETTTVVTGVAGKTKKRSKNRATSTVKSRHIRAAAREKADAVVARTRKEVIEYFEAMKGPVYGYPDGAVWQFVDKFVAWAAGEIKDATLDKYWDKLVEKAYKGTAQSVVVESKDDTKPSSDAKSKKKIGKASRKK